MARQHVIIELSRGRLECALVSRGRVVRAHQAPLDAATSEKAWAEGLRPLDGALRESLDSLGAQGATVDVLHRGPETFVQVFSCPAERNAALGAARLALADGFPYPLAEHPWAVCAIGRDVAGAPLQTHTLAAATHTRECEAIVSWVERAGCAMGAVCPADAVTLRAACEQAVSGERDGLVAILRLGEHGAACAVGERGRLRLIRSLDLSLDLLVDAIVRSGARAPVQSGDPMDREEARRVLYRCGVPGHDDCVDEKRGLRGADILPLLQPMLQRCVVEVRQSLRFGLTEEERAGATLVLTGSGALAPGLGQVLSSELEIPAVSCPKVASPAPGEGVRPDGALRFAIERGWPAIDLQPPARAREVTSRSARRGLLAGTALTLIVVGVDAGAAWSQLRSTRIMIAGAQPGAVLGREAMRSETEARALVVGVAAAEARIRGQIGVRPDWRAWLETLTRLTPDGVRLMDIGGHYDRGAPQARLRGVCMGQDEETRRAALTTFIESLTQCPLVASVRVGATEQIVLDGADVEQFELTASLVGDAPDVRAMASAVPEVGR